jgi:hypothetical protein
VTLTQRRPDSRPSEETDVEVGRGTICDFDWAEKTCLEAIDPGTTTVAFGLTRSETAEAFESRRYTVRVR